MIVAGVMSGTSADGINVALVRFNNGETGAPARHRADSASTLAGDGRSARLSIDLVAHAEYPFPAAVRRAILETMNAELAHVADLARLNFLLGELYAEAVAMTARKHRAKPDLVGCHGQTIYHQGVAAPFLGRRLAVTWQMGEGAVIAARLGVPAVSDFRPVRHGGRRQGRSAGSLSRLFSLSRPAYRANRAEHWRDCESHRNPGGRFPPAAHCVRHGPGQHGHRCGHGRTCSDAAMTATAKSQPRGKYRKE